MYESVVSSETLAALEEMTIAEIELWLGKLGLNASGSQAAPDGYRLPGIHGAVFYDEHDLAEAPQSDYGLAA